VTEPTGAPSGKRRLIKWLTRLSFTVYFLSFAAGITALCWCPCFYYAAAGASLIPIALGPKRLHRYVGVLLLVLAIGFAKDTAQRKAEDEAKVARIRATAERRAATQQAANSPAATEP